jgi:elongation factor G
MAQFKLHDIRNVVLCGNGSSGKTTLLDKILNFTGAVKRDANVENGTSICDFDEEEKTHKHTIESKAVHFDHGGKRFNFIDTPGYPDFIGQVIGPMHAVETAIITIDAHLGIGVSTRRLYNLAGELGLGRVIVITKMDSENIDYAALLQSLEDLLGSACMPLNIPIGHGASFKGTTSALNFTKAKGGELIDPAPVATALLDAIVEMDEEVTARYLDGTPPTPEETERLLDLAIEQRHIVPVLCVSAKTGAGLPELLDTLDVCCLPADQLHRKGINEANGEEIEINCSESGPLIAEVFKTRIDPFLHKLSFIRIFSGTIRKDENVHVGGERKAVKLHHLLRIQGAETEVIDSASAGEIVVVAKVDELHTGISIGDAILQKFHFPTPMAGWSVSPKTRGDEAKLSGALQKIVEEDGTVHLHRDPQTKELVIQGMSELHLHMLREKLRRRDKVEIDAKEPKIAYRETIQNTGEGSYRHKKQSGGRGQFGEVHIRMYPFPTGTNPEEFTSSARFPNMREFHFDSAHNFLWIDSIVGGSIPNNFLPAVEKGFKDRLDRGVVAGFQIQDVAVEVHFGKYHDVDSSEAAFKTAGTMAFRDVFRNCKPGLLEPIVKMQITVPNARLGDISSDLSGRRGRVLGMDSAGGDLQVLTAEVPLSEVSTYGRTLSSLTAGQGSFSMELSHYALVPGNVYKEIVEKAVLKEEEEE